jgi:hypothetical protein
MADRRSDADIRVLRGSPTDEELAAVVAVLMSIRNQHPDPTQSDEKFSAAPRWTRKPLHHAPGAWQSTIRLSNE